MKTSYLFSLTFILFAFCSISIQGQSAVDSTTTLYTHTVYQSDGSILTGEITAWTSDYIRLRLRSGLEIELKTADVKKVISDDLPHKSRKAPRLDRSYEFKENGVYHVSTGVFSAGPGAGLGITHAVGYRFSRLLGIGAGTGIETYEVGSGNQFIPLFAEARGFFLAENISPYYALRAGYGFGLKNPDTNVTKSSGGAAFSAELGYRFGGSKGVNFFTGVGVHFQKAEYNYQWPWEERVKDAVRHRRTEIKFGVIF
jgi:hypothetical protein